MSGSAERRPPGAQRNRGAGGRESVEPPGPVRPGTAVQQVAAPRSVALQALSVTAELEGENPSSRFLGRS